MKRGDSFTSRASFKATPTRPGLASSGISSSSKKSYRHIEAISFASLKSVYHFSESGTGFDNSILIQTSELTPDHKILKQYAFQITSGKTDFFKKLRMYFNRFQQQECPAPPPTTDLNDSLCSRPLPAKTPFCKGSLSDLGAFDFSYAEMLASSLSKSRLVQSLLICSAHVFYASSN